MKNKTIALWVTFLLGPLGLHRVYLKGRMDAVGWLLPVSTLIGVYGVYRARDVGLDDTLSWLLIPFLGFVIAGCALNAIVYGLVDAEAWNRRFNPQVDVNAPQGQTGWWTVVGMATALLIGATVLLSTIAFSFQRYFEYEQEESKSTFLLQTVKKFAG